MSLFSKYVNAHNSSKKSKAVCQSEVNEELKLMKSGLGRDMTPYHTLMSELEEKIKLDEKKRKRGSIVALLKSQKEKKLAHEESGDLVDLSEPAAGGSKVVEALDLSCGTKANKQAVCDNADKVPNQDSNLKTVNQEDHTVGEDKKVKV